LTNRRNIQNQQPAQYAKQIVEIVPLQSGKPQSMSQSENPQHINAFSVPLSSLSTQQSTLVQSSQLQQ
jgi:hypothetical protein